MISEKEIENVVAHDEKFRPAVLSCRYHAENDRLELVTSWCIIVVDRSRIDELKSLSHDQMESIYSSETAIHVDSADVDINSAGLVANICKQLQSEVAASF